MTKRISVPSIDLTDMSRLRVIAHLQVNGLSAAAKNILPTIQSEKAKHVAEVMIQPRKASDKGSKKLAAELLSFSKPAKYGVGGAGAKTHPLAAKKYYLDVAEVDSDVVRSLPTSMTSRSASVNSGSRVRKAGSASKARRAR